MSQRNDRGRDEAWMHALAKRLTPLAARHAARAASGEPAVPAPCTGAESVSVAELRQALHTEMESLKRRGQRLAASLSLSAYDRGETPPKRLPRWSAIGVSGRPAPLAHPSAAHVSRLAALQDKRSPDPDIGVPRPGRTLRMRASARRGSPPPRQGVAKAVGRLLQRLRPAVHAASVAPEEPASRSPELEAAPRDGGHARPLRRRYLVLQRAMAQDELALRQQIHERLRALPGDLRVPVTQHSLGAFIKQPAFTRWLSSAESQNE